MQKQKIKYMNQIYQASFVYLWSSRFFYYKIVLNNKLEKANDVLNMQYPGMLVVYLESTFNLCL